MAFGLNEGASGWLRLGNGAENSESDYCRMDSYHFQPHNTSCQDRQNAPGIQGWTPGARAIND
jgi:hypothetical protein